jgi:hypothetical protein
VAATSPDDFRQWMGILGIQPALGRLLTSADYGRPVAVLSFSFWTVAALPPASGVWISN